MNIIPILNEKSKGALVSFAVGDALGWPNERRTMSSSYNKNYNSNFKEWQKKSGGRYWGHNEIIMPGEYSDDTQLTLAIARSLLSGQKWDLYFTKYELPYWKQYERGGGKAVLRAASLWANNIFPWKGRENHLYFSAGGNGAAMRVIPHVIFHLHEKNFEIIADEITQDALITHGHPRAILGALCYAYAVYYSLLKTDTLNYGELISEVANGMDKWGKLSKTISEDWLFEANKKYDYKETWNNTVNNIVQELNHIGKAVQLGMLDSEADTLSNIGCFDGKVSGAGDIAAISAIYLASKYANNPKLGIKQAANLFGADTDTIAAMTGGILGSLCGIDWLPYEWRTVQDYFCLELMAECLLVENGTTVLKDYIAMQKQDEMLIRLPIGKAKFISENIVPCGKIGQVKITKYLTVLGQSVYVKDYIRIPDKNFEEIGFCKLNILKLRNLFLDNPDCDISVLKMLEILEMKNNGKSIQEISCKVSLNEDIVKNIMKCCRL